MSLPPAAHAITPADAKSLTGGLVNLVETELAAWRAALANLKDKAYETFTAGKNLLPTTTKIPFIEKRIMPMPNIPDTDKEHLEELSKKRLMSLEDGNAHRNQ